MLLEVENYYCFKSWTNLPVVAYRSRTLLNLNTYVGDVKAIGNRVLTAVGPWALHFTFNDLDRFSKRFAILGHTGCIDWKKRLELKVDCVCLLWLKLATDIDRNCFLRCCRVTKACEARHRVAFRAAWPHCRCKSSVYIYISFNLNLTF